LNKYLLAKDEQAVEFLRKHVSKPRGEFFLGKALRKEPQIWLVTGLEFSLDTTAKETAFSSSKVYGKVELPSGPVPDPTGLTSVSGGVHIKSVVESHSESTFPGERITAARYARLKVEFQKKNKGAEIALPNEIRLHLHQDAPGNKRTGDRDSEDEAEDEEEEEDVEEAEVEEFAEITLEEDYSEEDHGDRI